jgi:hypothetical protein
VDKRTEFWLQVQHREDGAWADCGSEKNPQAVWMNIEQLQKQNPEGRWRCVERVTLERDVSREEAEKANET